MTDKAGRYIGGLDKSAFSVRDNELPQAITYFSNSDVPISVGILLDRSGSMAMTLDSNRLLGADENNVKKVIGEGLSEFIRSGNTLNDYFLIGFNDQVTLVTDWTEKGKDIVDRISSLKLHGKSALYDGCLAAVEKLSHSKHQKKVVLIISDGEDNSSKNKLNDIRRSLKSSNVLIYGINIHAPLYGIGRDSKVDELAQISGGISLFASSYGKSTPLFALIAQELHNQYLVGFTPPNSFAKSEWRKLQIKVTLPSDSAGNLKSVVARSRKGYTTL